MARSTPWLRPVPSGRPFHQLGVGGPWWRLLAGLPLFAVLAIGAIVGCIVLLQEAAWAATGHLLPMSTHGDNFFKGDLANFTAFIATLAVLIPVVWVITLVVDRRWIGSLSSVAGRLRWRWLLLTIIPAVGYLAASYALSWWLLPESDDGGKCIGWSAFLPPLLIIVAFVPFQAAAEEYMFRGWLVQALGAFTFESRQGRVGSGLAKVFGTPWPAIVIAAVPFAAGHEYTDWGPVDIGAFAVVLGWVAWRTGGLEAGIVVHALNNMVSMGFSAADGDLSLDQGAVKLSEFLVDSVPLVAWGVCVVLLFGYTGRRRPMNRLS